MKTRVPPLSGIIIIAATLAASNFAAAEEPAQGLGISSFISHDSDDFTTRELSLSYFPHFEHGQRLMGARYTAHYYQQDDWENRGRELSFIYRDIEPSTWEGFYVEAGWHHQNDHNLATLDGTYSRILNGQRRVEVFVNRDWVETEPALASGIHFTFVGGVLEQGIGPHITLVGVAGHQAFSDGNDRDHVRGKIIYQPSLDLGLTLQLRHRQYNSATDNVERTYFNPLDYARTMGVIGWRHWQQGWMTNLTLGAGEQTINNLPDTPTRLFELELRAPPSNQSALQLRAGYLRSATFRGPDYTYRYLQVEWIQGF